MIAQVENSKTYTLEEYLELEVNCALRNEYIDGAIIPMTGATPNHNRITRNLCTSLTVGLRGQPYEVFVADQRLWIPRKRIYTYPDVTIVQGDLQLQDGRKDTITNPLLIVEVLSESTMDYDRTGKFAAYRTIPTFQHYVLIDQYSQHIEQYVKIGTRKWEFQEYDATDTVLSLSTIALDISLADIYDKVEFDLEPDKN
jgi:Uma2 family endonuclease